MTKRLVTPAIPDLVTVVSECLSPHLATDSDQQPCHCPEWIVLHGSRQDRILEAVTRWSAQRHSVDITLAAHGNTVTIHALRCPQARQHDVAGLMEQLCLLADCAGFTMRWIPADTVEADRPWQARMFGGARFVPGAAPLRYLSGRAYLVREPVPGRGHGNPELPPLPSPSGQPATVQPPHADAALCPKAGFLCLIRAAHDGADGATPGT